MGDSDAASTLLAVVVDHDHDPREESPRQCVRVAYQGAQEQYWYFSPSIRANQSKRDIMRQVRDRWNDHVPTSWLWRHLRSLLWQPMAHIGTLSTAHVDNFDLSQGPEEVVLRSRQLAQDLSALLAGHNDISAVDNFATEYPHVITGADVGNVLAVSYEIKRKAMFYLLVIGLMASALVGLALGISRASIEVGFTVFGGMTILVTAPLGVVFWMKP